MTSAGDPAVGLGVRARNDSPPVADQVRLELCRTPIQFGLREEAVDQLSSVWKIDYQAIAVGVVVRRDGEPFVGRQCRMCKENHDDGVIGWSGDSCRITAQHMAAAESVIRRMTRLAVKHGAVNLAQGFTDEAPPYPMVWKAIAALLGGTDEGVNRLEELTLGELLSAAGGPETSLQQALEHVRHPSDSLSQYSYPFGLPELREGIASYTQRWHGFHPDPEREVTVVLGATEGLASVLGSLCQPGDGVIVIQPFHEMYPSQSTIFGLRPVYVTLIEEAGRWRLDPEALSRAAAQGARALVLNTPHNPTGKVFTRDELEVVATLAVAHDLVVVTDEIYEQITFDGHRHVALASLPNMRDRTVVVNSISKTGNATGWRVGWVIAEESKTARIRAVHDTLVIQAPTPLQKAAVRLLEMPEEFFAKLRDDYVVKRRTMMDVLRHVGFRVTSPEGAYYLLADYADVPTLGSLDPTDAAMFLIEQVGVASVPGDNFYADQAPGRRYLRFAFCRGLDTLQEASRRLERLG